jgi:hypothetical protein
MNDSFYEQYKIVQMALTDFQNYVAEAPEDDWRSSLAWEAIEEASSELSFHIWEAVHIPDRPRNFRHWRKKYSDEVL